MLTVLLSHHATGVGEQVRFASRTLLQCEEKCYRMRLEDLMTD